MDAIAIIPARGGSKGLPRKNVRPLCGKPLIAWTIEAAHRAARIGRVIVTTDDPEIAAVSRRHGAEVVDRPAELSHDSAQSEAALLHALDKIGVDRGKLAFLQCTSPLTLPADIDGVVALLEEADAAFTAAPFHRFLWRAGAGGMEAVGHDWSHRPMRQARDGLYIETGAVYGVRIEGFLRARHRFFGRLDVYPVDPERSPEIDDATDFIIVETLMRKRLQQEKAAQLPEKIGAVVSDFDGVLTDNRVAVAEDGSESIACHRGDGWAFAALREAGIPLLVLTGESNPAVRRRCEKLGVECIVAAEKLSALSSWLSHRGIAPRDAVYIGNDVPDVACMLHAGCGVAPADALPAAKAAARIVLDSEGGRGCIRELADLIFHRRAP